MTRLTAILCAASLAASGCASGDATTTLRHFDKLHAAAATVTVDLTDGVSEVEAYKIAANHSVAQSFVALGGGIFAPKDEGAMWRVSWRAGIAGQIGTDIVIRKCDGAVTVEQFHPVPRLPVKPST